MKRIMTDIVDESIDNVSEDEARQTIKRICLAYSKSHERKINLVEFSDCMALITDEYEVVSIRYVWYHPTELKTYIKSDIYFPNAKTLLYVLMQEDTRVEYHPFEILESIHEDFSKMFGTNVEQININLDLMLGSKA